MEVQKVNIWRLSKTRLTISYHDETDVRDRSSQYLRSSMRPKIRTSPNETLGS